MVRWEWLSVVTGTGIIIALICGIGRFLSAGIMLIIISVSLRSSETSSHVRNIY
jgi:hypothetical protein